ncbi:MAG TPA: lysophospholipid acyltransferase family protein [Povalibacter sp.]|nr:lysophospholipid acyltransferase family protein [Povalibacter sp.]
MSLNLLHSLRRLLELLYGLYVVCVFLILGLLALVMVTLIPGLGINARRGIARLTARSFLICAGFRTQVRNAHELPAGPCVVVANHASYLDGVLLKGYLPARFSFVIKKEVAAVPLAGRLLRRIGSEFVDRFNRHAGAMDTRRLIKAADSGQALVFFPEGTFIARPGVGKFHTGAFAIAARARLPIVPVVIRGTRRILSSGQFLPRPGRIEIEVLPPIAVPAGVDSSTIATMTRDQARARILAAVGEPDLADSDGIAALDMARKSESG